MTALEFKHLRESLGFSVRELAREFDCHERTIMRIEAGEGPTRITELAMQYLLLTSRRTRVCGFCRAEFPSGAALHEHCLRSHGNGNTY